MKRSNNRNLPKAKSSGLLTREIPGELLVYDMKRHRAYCLNETVASIWKQCNGKRTVNELTRQLEKSCKVSVDESIVWLALDQLEKRHLLDRGFSFPPQRVLPRRELIKSLGLATAVALPIVVSIVAPTAASAATAITQLACQTRKNNGPGGCGGEPCSNAPGTCQHTTAQNCDCV